MHRVPLHRSLLFWAGVMVILALWGACLDSTRAMTELSYKEGYLTSQGCGLNVSRRQVLKSKWNLGRKKLPEASAPGLQWRRPMLVWVDADGHSNARDFKDWPERLTLSWMWACAPGDWHLYLPYWLLIAVVAAVWLLGLVGLARWRRRRAMVEERKG